MKKVKLSKNGELREEKNIFVCYFGTKTGEKNTEGRAT